MTIAFERLDLETRIAECLRSCGIPDVPEAIGPIAAQANAVAEAEDHLHLTAIRDPAAFVERHVGESLQGAAMIAPEAAGALLDLGSGNGYPGIPLALVRRRLRATLVESSARKAAFLRGVVSRLELDAAVLERQVQRPTDLPAIEPPRVLATRAMGNWERILPRFATCLAAEGELLLWAGPTVETIARRAAWRRFELVERRPLAGRERSWVWKFAIARRG